VDTEVNTHGFVPPRPSRPPWWRVSLHAFLAILLALLIIATGWIWNTRVAGGADSYGYVSQADLWLHGRLFIDQAFVARAPWPLADQTFSPLGYRPDASGTRLVPIYSPGLPMLMAAAKALAGPCGVFAVVPIAGGALVLATYWIGRRLGRPVAGLAASWIVATSPTLLYMVVQPMSDVPAAAAWAIAIACLLGETPWLSAAAGAASAVAILVRPNLAPIAIALFAWAFIRHPKLAMWFSIPTAGGAAIVAIVNSRLHGSPFAPGYDLTGGFSVAYVWTNAQRYGAWLAAVETPVALAGLIYGAVVSPLLGVVAAIVCLSYLVYVPFDVWWYLRFLLPSWPVMAIGSASLLLRTGRAAAPAIVALGLIGLWQAAHRDAFALARGEARYVDAAKVVESVTRPDAIVIAAQHSGSLRFYAGRLTLRWDFIDPLWLDRVVEWLAADGHHPYFLLEDGEVAAVRERFGDRGDVGKLNWEPLVTFRSGAVRFYDALARDRRERPVDQAGSRPIRECLPQRPLPTYSATK
jgi:hypothetical protein